MSLFFTAMEALSVHLILICLFFFSDFTYLNAYSIKIENLPAILQSYYQYQDTTWCTVDAQ